MNNVNNNLKRSSSQQSNSLKSKSAGNLNILNNDNKNNGCHGSLNGKYSNSIINNSSGNSSNKSSSKNTSNSCSSDSNSDCSINATAKINSFENKKLNGQKKKKNLFMSNSEVSI